MGFKRIVLSLLMIAVFAGLPGQVMASEIAEPETAKNIIPSPNNRFGIHLNEPDSDIEDAKKLVNTNGDWGWVVMVIRANDRNKEKWQRIFNKLREDHLIPVVRIAGRPNSAGFWERPSDNDAKDWADFLDSLIWPIKTRFVTIYNEPNHANEWGGSVDPVDYARRFVEQAKSLKEKSPDFFILNGAIDAAPPNEMPNYASFEYFVSEAVKNNSEFLKYIDGWASHSYPNPDFAASERNEGRATIKSYVYEKKYLESLGKKIDYVFVTETGWKHSDGINSQEARISSEEAARRYKIAFEEVWTEDYLVMVAPFIINYPAEPFDSFSFLNPKVLGEKTEKYLPNFNAIKDLPKTAGRVFQETKAKLTDINLKSFYKHNSEFSIKVTLKNTGQSIWGDGAEVAPRVTGAEQIRNFSIKKLGNGDSVNSTELEEWVVEGRLPEIGSVAVTLSFTPVDQNQNELDKKVNVPIYVASDWEYIYLRARDILSAVL